MSSLNAAPERWLPDLPYDRAGSAGSQSEHHSLSVTLPLPLATTALDGLAGSTGVSADQVVLAAWVVVLATYSGRSTLSIGVQVDGRLVRTEVDAGADLTLSSLAARLTDALDASGAPGPRDTAIFAFRGDHEGASFPSDIPFALRLESRSGEYRLTASYDPARFERSTVARMVGHVEVVLSQAVETDGAVTVGEAVVVPPTESAVLARWNATQVPYDETATLVSLFGAVGRGSEAVAVQYGDRAVSYAEFERIARRVAGRLIDLGTQRGSCVGVLCERSVELVAALHGVVMAGAAYVPLDPEYPPDRLDYMVSEAGIRIVLCQDRLGGLIERTDVTMVDLGQLSAERGDGSTAEPYAVAPDDVAYVIYTSGSTGRPKGVANAHRGIANRLLWMQDRFQLHPGDVVLQKTPFSFDVSVWELFWPLQVGARLVIAEPGGHRDPAYLVQTIVRHGVDTIHFVPSMLRLFLDHPAAASCTSLRRVVCSGEALTRDLQDRFFAVLPDAELHNLYGPTEAAVDVTAWQCRAGDPRSLVPIGAPIHNTKIHILDGRLRPVPIGVSGELHIGGVQVAVGYVNQPGLTAERFIPDPFDPPGRLYRTGDLARWLPDGQIEFLGRLDHQIKLRGQRIELGEVEATLGEHPAVLESAVTLAEIGGEPALVAHVVWRPGSADEAELRSFLERRLPAVMVPGHFVAHDALPLTSSGKLDRKALTAPLAERPAAGAPVRGADDLEQFLLDCWRDVLGHEAVGPDDRVFDLGATSLQAAAFVNRVQRELGEFIYVVTVFTAPTVHAYAALLQREYPAAIARRFGVAATRAAGATQPRVDEAAVQRVDGAVPRLGPYPSWRQGRPNKPAVFILSPPRSGTTLLRVMLAGHSRLFAAPELQLLNFDTLPQRRASLAGVHAPWREGTIRAVMELERCDADSATELMESHERAGSTAKAFFGWLQERAGDRTVVDKSPTYALDVDALRNAEHGFDAARYIHLVRDPHTMSRSFASYHMDQILPLSEQPYGGRALGELVWTISHRNILAFTEAVPEERVLRLHFEDLIADPRAAMLRVSSFLGLDFEEALVNPYDDLERKMVDGLHPESTPMGDTRMLERGRIDPKAGAGVAADTADSVLGEPTRRLAAVLRDPVRRTGDSADRRRFADIARRRRAARRANG